MSEHDEKGDVRVEDLDVPEGESEDVKGGFAYAKVKFEYRPDRGTQSVQPNQLEGDV